MKAPFKCNKCGAPIELDPYKDFVKCKYCGSTNIFENGRLISKSDRYFNKVKEYLPETEDRGIAELIVTKHRNGPVGTVKLLFEPQFTRYRNLAA